MRITVVGAGAIGCFVGGRLAQAGHEVTAVARGPHLQALQAGGLRLGDGREPDEPIALRAVGRIAEAPDAELVVVTLKAHQLPGLADDLAAAAAGAAGVLPIQNGLAWWYFQAEGAAGEASGSLRSVDPDGRLAAALPPEKLFPVAAFKSAEVVAPGVVHHRSTASDSFPLGPVRKEREAEAERWRTVFAQAGLPAPAVDVRRTAWWKLLGNIWANPIGALTGATVGTIASFAPTVELATALMAEATAVARACGVEPGVVPAERLARGRAVGDVKSSMLQDRERGRLMELDAILGSVVELAALRQVPVPSIQALHACLALIQSARSTN